MRDWYSLGDYLEHGNIYSPYSDEIEEYRVPRQKPPEYDVAAFIEGLLDAKLG